MAFGTIPLNVGPMQITHYPIQEDGTYGAGTVMGPTKGGCTLAFSFETLDSTADISGNFARGQYYVGGKASISANYTELTMEQVLALFPSTNGNVVTLPVGKNAADDAIGILLRPIIESTPSTDETTFIFLPRAIAVPNFNTNFSLDEQRIYTVDYTAIPYDAVNNDYSMLYLGDIPASIVLAS